MKTKTKPQFIKTDKGHCYLAKVNVPECHDELYAYFELDEAMIKKIKQIQALIKQNKKTIEIYQMVLWDYSCSYFETPNSLSESDLYDNEYVRVEQIEDLESLLDGKDDMPRVDCDQLQITEHGFWFSAYTKWTSELLETHSLNINEIVGNAPKKLNFIKSIWNRLTN